MKKIIDYLKPSFLGRFLPKEQTKPADLSRFKQPIKVRKAFAEPDTKFIEHVKKVMAPYSRPFPGDEAKDNYLAYHQIRLNRAQQYKDQAQKKQLLAEQLKIEEENAIAQESDAVSTLGTHEDVDKADTDSDGSS